MTAHNLYTISNTAETRLVPPGIHSGKDLTLQNVSASGYIYIGGEGVTAENYGYRLLPNHSISFELSGQDAIYVIASAPDTKLATLDLLLESQDG